MDTNGNFNKEDVDRVIRSFTSEEKEKLVKEENASIKTYKQLTMLFMISGALSLLASVIMLIISVVNPDFDMEAPLIFFIVAAALICAALFLRNKTKHSGKSTDEVLFDLIVKGLTSTNKWYVNFMKKINVKLAIPYADFRVDKNIEICSQKFEYLLIDDIHEEFIIKSGIKYSRKYSFKEVSSFTTLENNVSASENAATGALIGGLIGGSRGVMTGAVLGAEETCSSMKVVITLNNLTEPQIILELLSGRIVKNSIDYKNAQRRMIEITSVLQYVLGKQTNY